MSERVSSYRDLKVWQLGMDIAADSYLLTREFPKSEIYGMTSQIRRASSSIPANIAEGHGRQMRGEYLQYLRIAQGSLKELEPHLLLSVRVGFATAEAVASLLSCFAEEGRMIAGLMKSVANRSA